MLAAIKRLPAKESYDRVFRMRRAMQCSLSHQLLPKDQQTKPEEVRRPTSQAEMVAIHKAMAVANTAQDTPYLSTIIKEIEAENKERADLESLTVQPKRR